jgi:hypothetical protein
MVTARTAVPVTYPCQYSFVVSQATSDRVRKIASARGWSLAQALRQAVEAGLPAVEAESKPAPRRARKST